jgi:thiamine-phosphate pyrophosphorylase
MKGLLFITHQTARYDTLGSIEIALAGGCRQIQLRMKERPVEEVEAAARRAMALCRTYGAALYIDDHVEVCRRVDAAGVHLGKADMPPSRARAALGSMYRIGGTANTFEDIRLLHRQGADYIGLGPFRFTATKKNLSPVLGIEGYSLIMRRCREESIALPVMAIGGITPDDIPALMRTGISGVALSSAILQAARPVEETGRIVELMNRYNE